MNETMTLNYWTGMMRCGCGGEVGGKIVVPVTQEEKAYIESCKDLDLRVFTQKLKDEKPSLLERIHAAAVEALEIQMAEDAYGYYDFSDEKFEGWTYEQQIDYIRKDADPNFPVEEMCEMIYEIPKK